jgi:DNA polymerase-1
VVQGSAADLIKLAMLAIHRDLPAAVPGARMLLQIHDELVFEVPSAQADALDAFVRDRMAHAMDLRVPLEVSSGRGATWAEA